MFERNALFPALAVSMAVLSPCATAQNSRQQLEDVVVHVARDGAISWQGAPVSMDECKQRLTELSRSNREVNLHVTGDEDAKYGDLVRIVEIARRLGLMKVGIATAGEE